METAATNAAPEAIAQSNGADTQTTESAPVKTETTAQAAPVELAKEPEWFQKRMNEMTARYRSEERERQQIAQERDQLRRELEQARTTAPEKAKVLADFDFDETRYQAYLFETAEKRAVDAARKARLEEVSQRERQNRFRKFQEREIAFEKDTKDYRDVAHYAPIAESVAEVIQDLDSGPEIAYFLGKNRDIALTLNELPTHIAAVELGRIDAKLTAERQAKAAALEAAKASKAVSQAPPPAPSIEGSNAKVDKDPHKMTDAEYAKWRKNQIAQRR